MTPDMFFSAANVIALCGWGALAAGIVLNSALLRDVVAGRIVPLFLSAFYGLLILLFWAGAEGGFSSLGDVAKLFANPWLLLAGWVHYLAFDLAIGAMIARKAMEAGPSRLMLVPILPLTFLFGPIGLLAFEAARVGAARLGRKAAA